MRKLTLALCILAASADAAAALSIPGIPIPEISALALSDKTLARTGLQVNDDDITSNQNIDTLVLTHAELQEAEVWGLTEKEEKRYVLLMQNRSGLYYKGLNLSPVDILGINARSETERNHFAELAARQEAQKISKNIAWNNAFYASYNKLFKEVPVVGDEFDPAPFAPIAYKPVILESEDKLYLFIKPGEAVKTILLSLIEAIHETPNTKLNLMLLECDDIDIELWANQHQIPRELVASGQISLYHGEPNFKALNVSKKTTPLLILTRQGRSRIVDLGQF